MKKWVFLASAFFILLKCGRSTHTIPQHLIANQAVNTVKDSNTIQAVSQEVPVLCYHNFTESTNTLTTLSRERFEVHIRSLVDSGYTSILPDQLYGYLTSEASLPSKPIMISFDDTRLAQYTIAAPILEKYGFKGVFFIMTVCVNKLNYMSSMMIAELSKRGHGIGVHTYDHPLVSDIKKDRWNQELKEPKTFLEKVIHNDVHYFAYPYGFWTDSCIGQLKKAGYKAAFQLDGKQDLKNRLYTIRRLMVAGNWSPQTLHVKIAKMFNNQELVKK